MPSSVFNGTAVKILKKILRFKDSNVEIITGDTDNPTSVAKNAPQGSIYIRSGTGVAYIKQDSGSSTNWNEIADSADLSGKADTDLNNLTAPTAVNQNLLPENDLSVLLGNNAKRWLETHSSVLSSDTSDLNLRTDDVSAPQDIIIFANNNNNGAESPMNGSNNSGSVILKTGEVQSTGVSGNIDLTTGNSNNGNSGNINITAGTPAGSGTQGSLNINVEQVNVNSSKIVSLADPTNAQDAATKNYVDTNFVPDTEKGAALGVATLDAGGKVPVSQLPNSIMEYKGTWNASTNTPTLADGIGNAGDVYIVSVAGTQNLGSGSITFAVSDWVVYDGSIWQKSVNSNSVVSVNGYTGVVVLTPDDVGAANQNLSNLTTTSINAPLIPDTNNAQDLGTSLLKWNNQYVNQIMDASTDTAAIDPNLRTLVDSGTAASVDWENRVLENLNGVSVDYGNEQLKTAGNVKLDWSATDISVNTRKIIGVVDPSSAQDAATKNYVDNADNAKVTGPASSIDSEIVLFDGATGKLVKRATGTGIVKATSGVYGTGNVSLTSEVTGTLPVANGGTNSATTLNNNRIMISSGGSIVEQTALTVSAPMRTDASGLPTTGNLNLATEVTGTLAISNGGTGQTSQTAAYDALSPNTTKGDITVFNGTDNVRLPVGTNGEYLVADSTTATGVKWESIAISSYTPTANWATGIPVASIRQIYVATFIRIRNTVHVTGTAYFRNDGSTVSTTWSIPITNGNTPTNVSGTMIRCNASGETASAASRLNASANNSTTIIFSNTGINTVASDAVWTYSFVYTLV